MRISILLLLFTFLVSCNTTSVVERQEPIISDTVEIATTLEATTRVEDEDLELNKPDWINGEIADETKIFSLGKGYSIEEATEDAKAKFSARGYAAFDAITEKYKGLSGSKSFKEVMENMKLLVPQTISLLLSKMTIYDSYIDNENIVWVLLETDSNNAKDIMFATWEETSSTVSLFSNPIIKALADNGARNSINEHF